MLQIMDQESTKHFIWLTVVRPQPYTAPFVVDTIGPNNITYWSTDNVGNVEPQNMVNFTLSIYQ